MTLLRALRRLRSSVALAGAAFTIEGAVRFAPGRGPAGPQRLVLSVAARPSSWATFCDPRGPAFLRAAAVGTLRADGLCAAAPAVGRAHLRLARRPSLRLVLAAAVGGRTHVLRATVRWPGLGAFLRGGMPVRGAIRRETDGAPIAALEGRLAIASLTAAGPGRR